MLSGVPSSFLRRWRLVDRSREFEHLAAAVGSADDSARRAQESAEEAVRLLRDLQEHREDATPQRFRRLLAACGALAMAIGAGYWLLIPAFSNPAPEDTSPGGVQVAIEQTNDGDDEYNAALRRVVVTSELDEENGNASYRINIPTVLEGKEFKVLLAGSSVIEDLAPILEEEFVVDSGPCSGDDLVFGTYLVDVECQIFTGIVGGDFKGLLQECRDDDVLAAGDEYFEFNLWGESQAVQGIDWAHKVSNVPELSGLFGPDSLRDWGGMQFDQPMTLAGGWSCQSLDFSDARTEHASSVTPSSTWASGYSWGPDYYSSALSVVSTSRSAAAVGNLLLAVTGVLSAVLVGLVSVTYQAWERHRRFLRARGSNS